jgi:hypothetical protein
MPFSRSLANNVFYPDATKDKRVRDQGTVASPGYRFGTHQGATLPAGKLHDVLHVRGEFGCLHIVRVSAKRSISPAAVDGILAGMPKSAEARQMTIHDAHDPQGIRQCFPVELRIFSRAGNSADIQDMADFISPQQIEKLVQRMGGMPDGAYHGFREQPRVFHLPACPPAAFCSSAFNAGLAYSPARGSFIALPGGDATQPKRDELSSTSARAQAFLKRASTSAARPCLFWACNACNSP